MPPGKHLLIAAAVLLALASAGMWASARWTGAGRGAAFAVPIAPARELDVTIWMPGRSNVSPDGDHPILRILSGPLHVMIWYQDHAAGTTMRLAVVRLPTWPLLAMA